MDVDVVNPDENKFRWRVRYHFKAISELQEIVAAKLHACDRRSAGYSNGHPVTLCDACSRLSVHDQQHHYNVLTCPDWRSYARL